VARKKISPTCLVARASLAARLRKIRQELFGKAGGPELARRLDVPPRSWYNYENGVAVPAEVLLSFLELTAANPKWLLNGEGPRFLPGGDDGLVSKLTPLELIRRGLESLERWSQEVTVVAEAPTGEITSEYVDVGLYPITEIAHAVPDPARIEGYVLAYRQWLPNPMATIGTRVIDNAMHPVLPLGSIVAVDRTVTDPQKLDGRMVAACPDGVPMIRWLEIHGPHLLLRPNHSSKDFPSIPVVCDEPAIGSIVGQVVWSWNNLAFQHSM
jgi:hypothetical protein